MTFLRSTVAPLLGLVACALVAVLALSATADAATCKSSGRAVNLSDARVAPDFKSPLERGESVTVPLSVVYSASDFHAYAPNDAPTRAYRCGLVTRYRANGRTVASFDGVAYRAYADGVTVAVWQG